MTSKLFKYLRILAVLLIVFIVFFSLPEFCSGHGHHHEHGHEHHDHDHDHQDGVYKYTKEANEPYSQSEFASPPQRPRKQMSISRLWMEALSSTLIISIAPFLVLFFMPLNHRRGHESLLKVLLSFASGGLLGDAFLHLIPHALQPHSHDHDHSHHHHDSHGHGHEHSHDSTGAWVLAGILAFLILDKCMRLVKGHSHSHGHAEPALLNDEDEKDEKDGQSAADDDNADAKSESDEDIQSTAFLNLIVDFVHNLTDGLAIGASYLAGETVGLVTTITVLIHEVPHEIGDFAILVQSGCSKKKAMLFQLVTALGAFLGTFISLVSGGGVDTEASSWALPFTAGGFIYISTVSIIPELLTDSSFTQSIKEILALLTGVSLMALVALFE